MMPWLKSALYAAFGVGMIVWVGPEIISARLTVPFLFTSEPARLAGTITLAVGAWVYFGCVADFAARGGTPAFWDPPRKLVVNPWFRLIRNPMYVGVTMMVTGRALQAGSPTLLLYAMAVGTCFHLFVILYEEPHLKKTFGDGYKVYCERVPRWVPQPSFRRLTSAAIWQNLKP